MKTYGIEELRGAKRLFANCNETFNAEFTAEQLLQIYSAYKACAWDITPDRWHPAQVSAALDGHVPEFDGPREPVLHAAYERDYEAQICDGELYVYRTPPSLKRFANTHI
jgi:hypothetical protein